MIELIGVGDEPILIPEWQRIALVIDYITFRTVYVGGEKLDVKDSYEEIADKIEEWR